MKRIVQTSALKIGPKWEFTEVKDSIMVNGFSLEYYLSGVKDEETRNEIQKEIIKWKRTLYHHVPHHNNLIKTGPAGRCLIFSIDHIRKEYPNMAVIEKTNTEKILCMIIDAGPVRIQDISEKLKISRFSIRGAVLRFLEVIPELIEIGTIGRAFTYEKNKAYDAPNGETFDGAYTFRLYKERTPGKRGKAKGIVKIPKGGVVGGVRTSKGIVSNLVNEMNGIPKEIIVKIQVSGNIGIVFGFSKTFA